MKIKLKFTNIIERENFKRSSARILVISEQLKKHQIMRLIGSGEEHLKGLRPGEDGLEISAGLPVYLLSKMA